MGSIFAGLFGNKVGSYGATRLTTFLIAVSAIFSYIGFFEVSLAHSPVYIQLATWISSGIFDISWGFMFDTLTVLMLVVVTTVSTIVKNDYLEMQRCFFQLFITKTMLIKQAFS